MAIPSRSRPFFLCTECLQSNGFGSAGTTRPALGPFQQIRGKKKKSTRGPTTLPARLLEDVKAFGRKGSIVPVTIGQMRNKWFPSGIAEYVSFTELRSLRLRDIAFERDVNFGAEVMDLGEEPADEEVGRGDSADWLHAYDTAPKAVMVEKIRPERAVELMDIFVPQQLDFYRQPIPSAPADPVQSEPERARTRNTNASAADDLLAVRAQMAEEERSRQAEEAKKLLPQPIYGSVSTYDVMVAFRTNLATNEEAARVVLDEDDIEFTTGTGGRMDDPTRVKQTGHFLVKIKVNGADKDLTRKVKVHAQDL